ncbi:DUF3016 domain-containing protein [Colwellia sp. E150_009]
MKTLTTAAIFVSLFCSTVTFAFAATAEITWTDYEKYRDIHPGEGHRKNFRENTFRNFEKHFVKLAAKLPEKQVLKIEVTDIDLAGDTHHGGINRLRIVKDIYFPRMNFSYQLLDASGSIIRTNKVELKDMNFMMNGSLRYRQDSLGYEKKMLDDWFFDAFKEQLVVKE